MMSASSDYPPPFASISSCVDATLLESVPSDVFLLGGLDTMISVSAAVPDVNVAHQWSAEETVDV